MRSGPIALMIAALAWPAIAAAEAPPLVDPGDAVPGHTGMTYLDLMRIALPDLALNPDDHEVEGHLPDPPPRHVAGHDFEGPAPDPVTLSSMQELRIRVGGHRRIALLADLGPDPDRAQNTELLILFDDEGPAPKVLDMADVGTDRYSGFVDSPLLALGPGDTALVTYSEHSDADITMGAYLIVSTVGDRLAMVDWFGVTSENLCSWRGEETARFSTRPDPGRVFRRIEVRARATFRHTGEEGCNDEHLPRAGVRVFRASYRWNAVARRFEAARSQLSGLVALNKKFP